MKYTYAAIFKPEESGLYSVRFPDIPGCYTSGDNMADAIYMAQDVLNLTLYDLEEDKKPIPKASSPLEINTVDGEFISVIAVDTETYRRFYENKSVKKTLTIPMWLNHKAETANINFSQLLQRALKEELHVSE
jgi:predicted RNase H-like HicB family nuclease